MFTRDSMIDNNKGTCFQPNHFCPLIAANTLSDKPLHGQGFSFDDNDFPPLIPPLASALPNLLSAHSKAQFTSPLTSQNLSRRNAFKSFKKLKRQRKIDTSDIDRSISSPKKPFNPTSTFSHIKPNGNFCEKNGKFAISTSIETPVDKKCKILSENTCEARLIDTIKKSDEELLFTALPCFGTSRPYPLLPTEWYEKIGMEREIKMKASKADKCIPLHDKGQDIEQNAVISPPYPLLPVEWYTKVGKEVENGKSEKEGKDYASKPTKDQPHATQFPFPLLKKIWYQRRGMLAAKNIAREKRNIKRKETLHNNTKISTEYENFTGTFAEAKSNLMLLISTAEDNKKKATLMATLKAAEYIETSGPILLTQEVGNIFREEQQRILNISVEKRPRTSSALIFSQLSRFLNIKQVYICGKAFIIENRNQKVNELIERLSNLTNSEKIVNDKIAAAIGDIFQDSLAYVDTKKARDVLKALFAQATSTKFVTKLQGITNKTSTMNARDELRTKINQFQDIQKMSGVVRNDMTNEQQRRLTKRIVENRKKNEAKLQQKFDQRGRKLKVEEFPEMSKIIENVFETGSTDDKRGGGLESHPRLITTTRYRTPDNVTFMRQAREIVLACAPSNFTVSLSSCYNYTENYRQNSHEAKRHHAGKNINANISLHRPPRDAVEVEDEVENMKLWSNENRMSLNMEKTYEMIVRGKVSTPLPDHIPSIERKEWLKLLGVTMEDIPGKWDKHFEEMMKKASRRMYILRVCKHYGLSTHQLDLLFNSLIVSLFTFAVEVWGGASYNKYVSQIDKFVNRAYRNGYTSNRSDFKATISNRDKKLWSRIINDDKNALRNLLPSKLNRPLRRRGHDFELPIVKTERFKNTFINRCLFNFI